MNTYLPFILPLFSVLVGYTFALFIKPKAKKKSKVTVSI